MAEDPRKVLLTYNDSNRVGWLPTPSSDTDLLAIAKLAISMFEDLAEKETSDIVLQTFDGDFKKWVDLPPGFVATPVQTFRVVPRDQRSSRMVRISTHRMNLTIYPSRLGLQGIHAHMQGPYARHFAYGSPCLPYMCT